MEMVKRVCEMTVNGDDNITKTYALCGFHRLRVLAHGGQDETLPDVCLDWSHDAPLTSTNHVYESTRLTELRIHINSLVSVFQRFGESNELLISGGTIVVATGVARISCNGFGVRLDGASKIASLEELVTLFTCSSRELGVDVGLDLSFLLLLLGLRIRASMMSLG